MHKPETMLENVSHKIPWDFEKQMYHPIQAGKPDLIFINKKKRSCHQVNFAVSRDHRVKEKEVEKLDQYPGIGRNCKIPGTQWWQWYQS